MKALIDGVRVVQVEAEPFPVAPPLFWADPGDDPVEVGWIHDEAAGKYSPPPPPSPVEV